MKLHDIYTKIRLKTKWSIKDLGSILGSKGSPVKPFRRILLYHGIDLRGEKQLNSRFLSQSELRKHFEWLQRECKVISLSDFFEKENESGCPEICITFDDGYLNNFDLAYPLLQEFGFQASFFITAAQLRNQKILWADHLDLAAKLPIEALEWKGKTFQLNRKGQFVAIEDGILLKSLAKYATLSEIEALERALEAQIPCSQLENHKLYWQLMGESELKTLAADPKMQLGIHGTSHVSLSAMTLAEAESEIVACRAYLQAFSTQKIDALAWPSGMYNADLVALANDLGIKHLLAVDYLGENDSKQAERLVINPHISFFNQREAILKGGYL